MRNPAQEWNFILEVLGAYAQRNRTGEVAAYAQQLHQLAVHCARGRAESGGWAGEFTRTLLLVAARDTADRGEHWDNPTDARWRSLCDPVMGDLCGTMQAGWEHFEDHLAPGFYEYIRNELIRVAQAGPRSSAGTRIFARRDELIEEHKNLVQHGVRPAAMEVRQYGNRLMRHGVAFIIAGDASQLRRRTLDRVRLDLTRAGWLTSQESIRFAMTQGGFAGGLF